MRGALFAVLVAAAPAFADTAPRRVLGSDEQRAFSGVGRLDTSAGFCTATLVSDRLALTAAHCLHDASGARLPTAAMWFRAGLRDGAADATRQVRRAAVHPDWRWGGPRPTERNIASDLALLELDQPLLTTDIASYSPGALPEAGGNVALASYGRGRDRALSLQEPCRVLGRRGAVARLDCEVAPGSSGAPVLVRDGATLRLGAVISAEGTGGALATVVSEALPALRAVLAGQDAPPRPAGVAGAGLGTRTGGWKVSRPPPD